MVKYGIIGCGRIAPKFIGDSAGLDDCKVVAVAAREYKRAEEFAKIHCPEAVAYGDYLEMCSSPNVDAVYIATPHSYHFEQIMMALNAGKHVICEKPITTDGKRLAILQKTAKDKGLLLMEAMWSRFLPALVSMKELIKSGELGSITAVRTNFDCDMGEQPEDGRVKNPALAGGALFDLGIYCLNAVMMLTDEQPTIKDASVELYKTGVDDVSRMTLKFSGFEAEISASIVDTFSNECTITLQKGSITVEAPAHKAVGYTVTKDGTQTYYGFEDQPDDFSHEIKHFNELIAAGITDSPIMGVAHSMAMIKIFDDFREMVGLRYPFDDEV